LAATKLSQRDLLIHALQHLEIMTEQLADAHEKILHIDAKLTVFEPLLDKISEGGPAGLKALWDTRKKLRAAPDRARPVWDPVHGSGAGS
jgi:hypothetical protein